MSDLTIRNGRSLGILTPTPDEDEGTCELLLSPDVATTFHHHMVNSSETNLDRGPADHWAELGFRGAVRSLLRQMCLYRHLPADEEIVHRFIIDEAQHGPLDAVIEELHDALGRIEQSRETARMDEEYRDRSAKARDRG